MFKRSKQALLAVAAALAVTLGVTTLTAAPAQALYYKVDRGPYDMRGYVSTPTTGFFGCSPGYVSVGTLSVHNYNNYGIRVYYTYDLRKYVGNGQWSYVQSRLPGQNGDTRFEGGRYIGPGQTLNFGGFDLQTAAGYWWVSVQVDIHTLTNTGNVGPPLGTVSVRPTEISDWNSLYAFKGDGYSYCYHS